MHFLYGSLMPLRILDETEFWKEQEADHTVVIRQLVQGLEPEFAEALRRWEQILSQTNALAAGYIETLIRENKGVSPAFYREVLEFTAYCLQQSRQFISLLNRIAVESKAVAGNLVAITLLNHVRRESEYFIGIARTILRDPAPEQHVQAQ